MPDRSAFIDALRHASTTRPEVVIHTYDTLDSTNSEAKRHAAEERTPALYIARCQTGGRGRLGRTFHSPADTGLYMSLAFTADRPLSELVHTTALAAVATVSAIESLTDKRPLIKWVNDLYLAGGKTAGILTEAVSLPEGGARMIVGIGINLTTTRFPDGLRAPATALFSPEETAPASDTFIGTLVGQIAERLLDLVAAPAGVERLPDGETCLSFYRRHLLLVDKVVVCTRGNESFEGILRGVDEHYSLLVEVGGEVRTLASGEISVRAAE